MPTAKEERRVELRAAIAQQRRTVRSLEREGHVCDDAKRHLAELEAELENIEAGRRPTSNI